MRRPVSRMRRALVLMTAAVVGLTGAVVSAAPAVASLPESHTFDGWQNGTLGTADFLIAADSQVRRDGPIALRMDYASPPAGTGRYAHVFQDVLVQPGGTYQFSAWVRADGVSADGAFYFPLTGSHAERKDVPGGTYDWQQLTWEYTIPTNQSSFRMRILARGPGTVWFDHLSMTAQGSSQNLLANPSFDVFDAPPGALSFTDETLIYETGDAEVGIAAADTSVSWSLRADSGQVLESGDAPVSAGATSVDLSAYQPGYYTLHTSVDAPEPATRTASVAIVDPASADGGAGHPVGMSIQSRRNSVPEVEELLTPLGLGTVRQGPSWIDIEKTAGVYDFTGLADDQIQATIARGERPMIVTPISNPMYDNNQTPASPQAIAAYAAMLGAMSEFYGDTVDYEIYNEFNHTGNRGSCGRTPECYMDLLVPSAAAVRAQTPEARILGPAIAGLDLAWLERFFELGGLEHIDAVTFHSYDIPLEPEGETEAEVAALKALLDEYGHPDMPILMSEHGWHTQIGGATEQLQGAYTVRSAVLLQRAGVEEILYYTLTDTGLDPAEKEHNFGIARSNLGVNNAIAPKPAYNAMSVFNRLTAGREYDRVGRTGGAYMGVYTTDGPEETRVLWAPDGETVTVTLSEEIQVVEANGRTWTAGGGGQDLQLTLNDQPVYLVGEVVGVNATDTALLSAPVPQPVALGAEVTVPVALDASALPVSGAVEISATAGESTTLASSSATGELVLEPFAEAGLLPLRIAATSSSGLVALQVGEIEVRENPALTVVPGYDGSTGEAVSTLRASSIAGSASATVGDVQWQIGDRSGTAPGGSVDGGQDASFELERGAAALWMPEDFRVTADVDGASRTLTGRTVAAPVTHVGDPAAAPGEWTTHGRWVSLGGAVPGSAADIGGTFRLEWDADALTIVADVVDDDHTPGGSAAQLWAGDSLQFAASPGLPGSSTARVEMGAALLADGPVVHSFTPSGPAPSAQAAIERNDASSTTSYRVSVPWDVLGVDPEAGTFSFSMALNDNDAGVREGYVEWGSGIGGRKEASYFLPVTLVAAAPTLSSLAVDGVPVDGFDSATLEYRAAALAGGPVPQVSAESDDEGAQVRVVQAAAAPGEATVEVRGADGAARTYRVAFERLTGDDAAAVAEVSCDAQTGDTVVSVRNDAAFPSALRVASTRGDERRDAVPSGETVRFVLDASSEAGTAEVSAYVPYAAPERAASYHWQEITLPACGS